MKEATRIVKSFDRDLRCIQNLAYHDERYALLVQKSGRNYVLKASDTVKGRMEPILREATVLRMLRDVPGVTHLVHDYGVHRSFTGFLKEYAYGADRKQAYNMPVNDYIWKMLEETAREIHSRGLAPIHVIPENVVIAPDGKSAIFVDLGECRLPGHLSHNQFLEYADFDLYALDRLATGKPISSN